METYRKFVGPSQARYASKYAYRHRADVAEFDIRAI